MTRAELGMLISLDQNRIQQYEARKALEEAMQNLTNEERREKILEYNMFEWNFPGKNKEKETTE